MNPVIGFLGVGAIGRPMAERMLASHALIVCDMNAAARAPFESRAALAGSARELADTADIVFACLPTPASYEQAVLGSDGLVAGSRMRQFVNVGTTSPELARRMSEALASRGMAMLDAPVSGGVPRARSGQLTVMSSGPRDLFDTAEPLIACFAKDIVYLGAAAGAAQLMKLINNVLSASNLAVACEVLVLGAKAGLDPEKMIEVLNTGTGQNSATLTKIPDHVLPRTFDYGGRLEVVLKDLSALTQEAARWGYPCPLAQLTEQTYKTAIAADGPTRDMTEVARHMERVAGVELAARRPS